MSDDSCFLVLGLNRGSPSEEIKRAYRNLSLKLHPDASGSSRTAAGFNRAMRAYKVLSAARTDSARSVCSKPLAVLDASVTSDVFALGRVLLSSCNPKERAEAAKHLGLSGKRSVWVFLRKGLYDADERVVCSCVRAAAVLGLAQGGAEIAGAWQRGSPACRRHILKIAEATRSNILLPALQAAIQSGQADLQLYSRRILKDFHS